MAFKRQIRKETEADETIGTPEGVKNEIVELEPLVTFAADTSVEELTNSIADVLRVNGEAA